MKLEITTDERTMILNLFQQLKVSRQEWKTLVEPFLLKVEALGSPPGEPPEVE